MPLNPLRETLGNGLTVLAKETHTTAAVTMLIGVRAGAFHDPEGREGTAALAARALDRGTTTRSAAEIADQLDGRGASLSVIAGRHQLTVSATCLAEDFDTIFALMADVVRRPAFADSEVATRRTELLTSILQDEDDPGAVAVDTFMSRLYPAHPYGRRPRGTTETVARLGRADLVEFHQRWFGPEGSIVVVVGDVRPERVIASVGREFDNWMTVRPSEPPLRAPEKSRARQFTVVPMMNKAQADIAYGFVGLRRSDREYYAAWVMNNALGQYALGGRLGDAIRERQGMAYYVYSALDASLEAGPLLVRAGVAPSNVERTLESIEKEVRAVVSDGVTTKELDESKRYLIGSIPRQLETNAGIAGFLLSAEFHGLGSDHDARLPGLLSAVALEDVNRIAHRLLDFSNPVVVVAGPWEGPKDGEAVVISASDAARAPALISSPGSAGSQSHDSAS